MGFVDFVDCGGRPVIIGWYCVCSSTESAEQRDEMRGVRVSFRAKGEQRDKMRGMSSDRREN